ncbi:GTP cyclohydrolase [Flavobacterium agrisoli]|uniref:GTP cyclohydrolase n=1 Tax=Flavobacterium agrisoli TaxID=2793066 RepID=A0A934UJX1_9FLAO|nr:GTP cyclohydrolase [Flavobacterium agrisoli]MBK0369989.1 GTP cyclohydrolase [Flavobacterium agrisoli]
MITIKEAKTKQELTESIQFSFDLYKNNPNWIPPIIADELETFDKEINPAFENAEAYFYTAHKNGKMVGRITAIINWQEVNQQGKKKVRFGWFDVIDDIEVSKALLEKVYELGRQHQMDHVEGPMGFSNLDKVGLLTRGFDEMGTMITWYNYEYYVHHLEQLGFVVEKQFIESVFPFSNVKPEFFLKATKIIKQRFGLRVLDFKTTDQIMSRVDEMFDLFNTSYEKLASFVAVSDRQKEYFKKKYAPLINPEYIKYIVDKNDKMVAFSIVMPSLSKALKKANGKLFPFGFLHLLWAKKHSKSVLFYLIGVQPEYQNKGVTALIFEEYYKVFKKNKIETCIRTPELLENNSIHLLWKNFEPRLHCDRKTFRKDLN